MQKLLLLLLSTIAYAGPVKREGAECDVKKFRKVSRPLSRAHLIEFAKCFNEYEMNMLNNSPDLPVFYAGKSAGTPGKRNSVFPVEGLSTKYSIKTGDHLDFRYEMQGKLGQGSYGEVYKAFDHKTERAVAIKLASKKNDVIQLKREEEILKHIHKDSRRRLLHSSGFEFIIKPIEIFEYRKVYGLVMPMISSSLTAEISEGFDGPKVMKTFIGDLFKAIAALSKRHVVHLDIKPDNVLIDAKGHPKLIDFGSSFICGTDFSCKTEDSNTRGTAYFMAPEVAKREAFNSKADVFSAGVLIAAILLKDKFKDTLDEVMKKLTDRKELSENEKRIWKAPSASAILIERLKQNSYFENKIDDVFAIEIIKSCLTYKQEERPSASDLKEYLLNLK